MLYRATHLTRYSYEAPVSQCFTEARLTPRTLPGQRVIESQIEVDPETDVFDRRTDYFGNEVAVFSIFRRHESFTTTATSVVDVDARSAPLDGGPPWELARDTLAAHEDEESLAAYEFAFDSPLVPTSPLFAAYGAQSLTPSRPLVEAAVDLSGRVYKDFEYKPKSTTIDMPLPEVFRLRRGVCQDYSHVLIAVLRSNGLAARYVSGYLRSGANFQGAEASHAWVSVFVPGYGWLDLDPTNNCIPSDGHITLAWGRDFSDVTPVKGISLGGGGQTVEVAVKVLPV